MKNALILVFIISCQITYAQLYSSNGTSAVTNGTTNVGIGTSTPNQKLEVNGIGRFTGSYAFSIGGDGNQNRIHAGYSTGQHFRFLTAGNGYAGIGVSSMTVGGNYTDLYTAPSHGLLVEGNVGIGTSSPQHKLDVAGGIRGTSYIVGHQYVSAVGGDGSYRVAMNSQGDGYISGRNNSVAEKFLFSSNGNSYFNGGNLGVGNSSPSAKLHVNGNGAGTTALSIIENPSSGAGAHFLSEGANNIMFQLRLTSNNAVNTELRTGGSSFLNAVYGSVGIGGTSANGKLEITNNASFNANEVPAGQDHVLITAPTPANGSAFGGITWLGGARRRASIVATQEHTDSDYIGLAFYTQGVDGPGGYAESMRITHAGNVGIGTTTPDARLAVKGLIHTQEVRVDLTGAVAPDYVFEIDYNLISLSEIEKYVQTNKHLPEVPSAKEMEQNGLNLKEMNLLLLKKVEELTLHLIEIKKENKNQQKEIDSLRSRIK
jgi:hypothetical protein